MRARVRVASIGGAMLVFSLGSSSRAHIDLLSPPPRAGGRGNSYLDAAPCGQRKAAGGAGEVSVFRPGETIRVSWDAYVRHPSYFRIAFDPDGDDSFSGRSAAPADAESDDPERLPQGEGELILDYVLDPGGELAQVERSVTLPSEPCEVCTLQLVQFVYGVPLEEATYYQCADLVLAGDPITPEAPEPSMAGAGSGGCALRATSSSAPLPLLLLFVAVVGSRRRLGSRSAPS